ncbi:uncharacterized protein LOC110246295 [Exaiptasia diaphana]|uniref:Uncharacterized protein n=1 Tax=Exaiptasia diaphana TaxID=2652724 RepID=A0A913XPV3_EXADI|nr:uncharacterized protein LOC110246295 [Exaiptasia diaphana]
MLIWFTKEIYKRICGMTEDIHFIDQYFDEVMVPFIMAHQPRKTDDGTSLYSNPNEHDTEKFELFQSLSDRVKMVIQGSSKDEVRKLMRLGRRQGSESITLHPSFFDNATFAMHQLVSHAIKSGLGSSEPRRMSSQKSVRCLVLDLKALEDCTSDLVRDFFSDDVNKTRLSPTKRMRTTPQEKREINSAPEPPAKKIKGASYQKRSMGRARSLGFKRRSKRR